MVVVFGLVFEYEVKDYIDDFENVLKNLLGVVEVCVVGLCECEIWVEVDLMWFYLYQFFFVDFLNVFV